MIGLCLGKNNGGPYKTLAQFRDAIGGVVVSISDRNTIPVSGDGVVHLWAKADRLSQWLLCISSKDQFKLRTLVRESSHVQCHILFRSHVTLIEELCRQEKKEYWVVPHGCLDPYVFSYRRLLKLIWMRFVGRKFLKNASVIVFATRREQVKAMRWICPQQSVVINWPCVTDTLVRDVSHRLALRASLGIPSSSRVLLWLGRLHPMKRPVECADLFASIMSPGAHLVFVGPDDGEILPGLRDIAQKSKHKNIHILGAKFSKEKDAIVAGADGYWSWSIRENFNHAAVECMSAGLPVILSEGNDLIDEIDNCTNVGWLVRKDGRSEMALALSEWAEASEESISSIGFAARAWVETTLSREKFEERLRLLSVKNLG